MAARTYFEEIQRFRDNRWVWFLIAFASVAIMVPMFYGTYLQLITGVPWGDEPMSDQGLIALVMFVTFSWGLAIFIMLSLRLDLKIDEQGVHFRFFPVKRTWRIITRQQVAGYSIQKGFKLFESGGLGYHRNIFLNTRSYRITGGNYLRLELDNDEKVLLGTQNPGEIEWAMKKLMRVNETI
jgi:hypothetical protein